MKASYFIVIFAVIFVAVSFPVSAKLRESVYVAEVCEQYDRAIDLATEAAAKVLIDTAGGNVLRREAALGQFFNCLYAGIGISDEPEEKERLNLHIPAVVVSDGSGFYISYPEEIGGELKRVWTEKMYYVYCDQMMMYVFGSNDTVRMHDMSQLVPEGGATILEADIGTLSLQPWYADVRRHYGELLIAQEPDKIREVRYRTVTDSISSALTEYIDRYNDMFGKSAESYRIDAVLSGDEDAAADSNNPMFMAFIEGYDINGLDGAYCRYAVSDAWVGLAPEMVVSADASGNRSFHYPGCSHISGETRTLPATVSELKRQGMSPCPYCCPNVR